MKNRRPSRDEGCCSISFLKYVLFIFNFLIYLAGVTVLTIGLWTLLWKSEYAVLLGNKTYIATAFMLIIAGGLVLFVGIIGCCGVRKEHRCCLLLFSSLLIVVFLVEVSAGAAAYIYADTIDKGLKESLNASINNYFGDDSAVSEATEKLHLRHGCCGSVSFVDWETSKWHKKQNGSLHVPDFCCRTIKKDCGRRNHPSNIYYEGCYVVLKDEIREQAVVIAAVALGISVVFIFGFLLSCCLYVKLKELNEVEKRQANSYY